MINVKKLLAIISVMTIFCSISVIHFKLMVNDYENGNSRDLPVFFDNSNSLPLEIPSNNSDVVGIINAPAIDLLDAIVKTTDNNYYTNHNINKNINTVGSIFMDYRNLLDSKKIIIYGHNSLESDIETGFGKLTKFMDYEFTKQNKYIKIYTSCGLQEWEIFSVMVVDNNTTYHTKINFKDDEELQEHLNWLINNSIFDLGTKVSNNDQLLTLQTCINEPNNSFLLINLKKESDTCVQNN